MTVAFQNPQTLQYPQYQQQTVQAVNPQSAQVQNTQAQYACTAYTHNPYLCAYSPVSPLVVPQGQIQTPSTIPQPPMVQPIQQLPNSSNVNYNQITPCLNGNSPVFQPAIETKSGQAIATASAVSQPVTAQEAQIVYQGPVKTVNPQITPIEQNDNEIDKQYRSYFQQKAEQNAELRRALYGSATPKSFMLTAIKVLGITLIVLGLYKYRTKIPIIKRFFK